MSTRLGFAALGIFATVVWVAGAAFPTASHEEDPAKEIRESASQFVKAFNARKASELAAMFLPQGEFIDDEGTLYRGPKEIGELLTKYFERFPGVELMLDVDSVRSVGPNMVIEEGTRSLTAVKGSNVKARLRYSAVRTKVNGKWLFASVREFNDDPALTPRDYLQPLGWLVGDWINEGADAVVSISYRWSEDGSFLLGDFKIFRAGKQLMRSSQRIGWDPLNQRVRSWLFDSDGGYSDGQWTPDGNAWIIKSQNVAADGQTGSATITITTQSKDRFTMKGTDRIVGQEREDDFDLRIIRKPPAAGK